MEEIEENGEGTVEVVSTRINFSKQVFKTINEPRFLLYISTEQIPCFKITVNENNHFEMILKLASAAYSQLGNKRTSKIRLTIFDPISENLFYTNAKTTNILISDSVVVHDYWLGEINTTNGKLLFLQCIIRRTADKKNVNGKRNEHPPISSDDDDNDDEAFEITKKRKLDHHDTLDKKIISFIRSQSTDFLTQQKFLKKILQFSFSSQKVDDEDLEPELKSFFDEILPLYSKDKIMDSAARGLFSFLDDSRIREMMKKVNSMSRTSKEIQSLEKEKKFASFKSVLIQTFRNMKLRKVSPLVKTLSYSDLSFDIRSFIHYEFLKVDMNGVANAGSLMYGKSFQNLQKTGENINVFNLRYQKRVRTYYNQLAKELQKDDHTYGDIEADPSFENFLKKTKKQQNISKEKNEDMLSDVFGEDYEELTCVDIGGRRFQSSPNLIQAMADFESEANKKEKSSVIYLNLENEKSKENVIALFQNRYTQVVYEFKTPEDGQPKFECNNVEYGVKIIFGPFTEDETIQSIEKMLTRREIASQTAIFFGEDVEEEEDKEFKYKGKANFWACCNTIEMMKRLVDNSIAECAEMNGCSFRYEEVKKDVGYFSFSLVCDKEIDGTVIEELLEEKVLLAPELELQS